MKLHVGIVSPITLHALGMDADWQRIMTRVGIITKHHISKQPRRWANPGLDLKHVFDPHCDCDF